MKRPDMLILLIPEVRVYFQPGQKQEAVIPFSEKLNQAE